MNQIAVERPRPEVALLALNRPQARNALDLAIREEIMAALDDVAADASVRALVIWGKGGHFCAGGDVTTMVEMDPDQARDRMQRGHRLVRRLFELEKPVVAAVEGYAVGAGAGLAMLADSIVIGEGATMGFPFFRLGLVPDWGILHLLPRRVGVGRARQLLLAARMVRAEEAVRIGLADELAPDAEVLERAVALAAEYAGQPAHAFRLVKRQLNLYPSSFEDSLELEALAQALCFATDDSREGRAAFREKRKPRFAGVPEP